MTIKTLTLAAIFAAVAPGTSLALQSYSATSLSCSSLKSIIEREKAIYVRYPSPRGTGIMIGGRFVPSANYCESAKRAIPVPVMTRDDRTCMIRICREQLDDAFN